MANEISISLSLSASKNGLSVASGSFYAQSDMSGDDMGSPTQVIGTTAEQIVIPADIATIGVVVIRHSGYDGANPAVATTKYVALSYNADGSSPFAYVLAGIPFEGRLTSTTFYGKAESGATSGVRIQTTVVEA